MKAVITGVAAIGLALIMPAFAQNTTKGPAGQYDMGGCRREKRPKTAATARQADVWLRPAALRT